MNITQLKQGSLNGLRRQTNECIDNAYRKGYEDGKKEPREVTNVEDTSEYQIGYKVGFEDGKKQAIEEIPELANKENEIYNDGYNNAINDYNAMYEWLHDCFVDFKKFLLEKGFYTDEKFSDGFVVGQLMYDLICDHDIAEVISEFKKWQEEKKKAEEVENYHILVDTLRTVTEEYPKETIVSALSEFGFEVDKLRGEEE